jgi:hypothetical protein
MLFNTTVFQAHHAPKARASDGLGSVRIGLSVAIRRTASWQPPRADNHRFAPQPPEVSLTFTGAATSNVPPPHNVKPRLNTGATGHDEGHAILLRSLHSCPRAPRWRKRHGIVAIVAQAHGGVLHTARRRVARSIEAAACHNTRPGLASQR